MRKNPDDKFIEENEANFYKSDNQQKRFQKRGNKNALFLLVDDNQLDIVEKYSKLFELSKSGFVNWLLLEFDEHCKNSELVINKLKDNRTELLYNIGNKVLEQISKRIF